MSALRNRRWWLLGVMSLVGYLLLPFWFPLAGRYNQVPTADIFTFTPSLLAGTLYALWLLIQFGVYWLAYQRARHRPVSLALVFGGTVLAALPLLLTFPINANDIYRYYIRARVAVVYGANPFVTAPDHFPGDPFLPLAGEWRAFTSPYGPVWELVAGGISRLAGDRLLPALLLFKVLGLALFLGTGWLLWQLLARRAAAGRRTEAERRALLLLWCWNPALLLTFVVNAHNDALLLFWLILAWWLLLRDRPVAGWLVALLAPLTKPIGIVALPIFLVVAWRRAGQGAPWRAWRPRVPLLVALLAGSPLLVALAFVPFGNPLALAQRLLGEAAGGAGFSPLTLVILLARAANVSWPLSAYSTAGAALFILIALLLYWRLLRGRPAPPSLADLFAAYSATALNFRIWYAVWPFPWLLLADSASAGAAARRRAGVAFLLTSQLSVVIYAHVRIFLLGGSQFWAHLLGVGFTFGLPLLFVRGRAGAGS